MDNANGTNESTQVPEPPIVPPVEQPVPPQSVAQPQPGAENNNTSSSQAPVIPQTGMPRGPQKKILGLVIAIVLIVFFLTGTVAVLAAYDVLPIGGYSFRAGLADGIQGLPFMPKTPSYVVRQFSNNVFDMQKFSFNVHAKTGNLSTLAPFLSMNAAQPGLEFIVEGKADITDTASPLTDLHIQSGKDIDLNFRTTKDTTFFKLNALPSGIKQYIALLGLPDKILDEIFGKWFSTPNTKDTSVKKHTKDQREEWNKTVFESVAEEYRDGTFMPKLTMTSDNINKEAMYKFTVNMDKKALDELTKIIKKANRQVYGDKQDSNTRTYESEPKNLTMVVWIEKNSYYLKKATVDTTLELPDTSYGVISSYISNPKKRTVAGASTIAQSMGDGSYGRVGVMPGKPPMKELPLHLDLIMSDIGKNVTIEVPANAVPFGTFIQGVMLQYQDQMHPIIDPGSQLSKANNVKRRSDVNALLNAINQYMADNQGQMPAGLTETPQEVSKTGLNICTYLVPMYIAGLPVDPSINDGLPVSDCNTAYSTGYTVFKTAPTDRVTVIAPYAEMQESISVTR